MLPVTCNNNRVTIMTIYFTSGHEQYLKINILKQPQRHIEIYNYSVTIPKSFREYRTVIYDYFSCRTSFGMHSVPRFFHL